jgi:AbrB family looped-hinge helix DNA binding protein
VNAPSISKVTSKYQATIPLAIREFLGVRAGDAVEYRIERDKVVLKRVSAPDLAWLMSVEKTLAAEWDSKADDEAFRDL